MRVRKLQLGREMVYKNDGTEIVKCPGCLSVWMKDGLHNDSPCKHLRFFFYTHGEPSFGFFGQWDHVPFEKSFWRMYDPEEGVYEDKVFRKLTDPNVDAIAYWDWDDFPLIKESGYWGYKVTEDI
jgi:hypothetical protein